jgi:hypothetical protein
MKRGLSLVQVLVASAVLVVSLLPLFTLFSSSVRTTEVSLDELRAALLAEELISQIRLLSFQPGFHLIPDMPADIRPPYTRWLDLQDPNSGFYQVGAPLPHPIRGSHQSVDFETNNWELLGAPACSERGPNPDPVLESLSRIYLSPLPRDFRRLVKVHPAPLDPSGLTSPNLRRVEVRIEWERRFQGTATQRRHLELTTLLGNPEGFQ